MPDFALFNNSCAICGSDPCESDRVRQVLTILRVLKDDAERYKSLINQRSKLGINSFDRAVIQDRIDSFGEANLNDFTGGLLKALAILEGRDQG